MDDRELLELAAKAAGICLVWDGIVPKEIIEHWNGDPNNGPETRDWYWNPLEDDGDALRLATKLRINIEYMDEADSVAAQRDPRAWGTIYAVEALDDYGVRRAIVRAAAEIGRSMP